MEDLTLTISWWQPKIIKPSDSKTKQTPHLWGLFRFGIKQGFAHPGRKRPTCNIVLG